MCVNSNEAQQRSLLLQLHLTKSKKQCLRPIVDEYNRGKPVRERLRSSHVKLMEYLLNLYYVRLKTAHGAGKRVFLPEQPLPALRTSNGALAKEMNVTKRTIMNLRERLEQAGLIAYKTWHGTNSSYEIDINPMIMHLQEPQNAANRNADFFSCTVKSFHHIEEGNLQRDTIEKDKRSGEALSTNADPQSLEPASAVENESLAVEKPEKSVDKPSSGRAKGTGDEGYETDGAPSTKRGKGTTPPSCAAPPENLPISVAAAIAHLDPVDQVKVARIARTVFAKAAKRLYIERGKWLSRSQMRQGETGLAEYIAWGAKPGMYDKVQQQLLERVAIVRQWLDHVEDDAALGDIQRGEDRWIPLPRQYFDFRNDTSGFINTDEWLKRRKARRARAARERAIDKAVIQYQKSLLPGAPYGPDQAYHQLSQTIRKQYGPEAVQSFLSRIADLQIPV